MLYKESLTTLAMAITFVAFYPYLRGIIQGTIKPHVFSWLIWGTTTFLVFLAQLDAGGGVGTWAIGLSGSITTVIAILAYAKRADVTITKSDWRFLIAALSSLPLADPVWAVIVLTAVDLLGFGPTIRKAHADPHSESPLFFALFGARNSIVVMALEHYSVATVLFPAAIATASVLLMVLIIYRRRQVASGRDAPKTARR